MNLPTEYTLIAHKPESSDYCRGCHMASYSGDYSTHHYITAAEVIDAAAGYLAKPLRCNEAGYTLTLITVWRGKLVTVEDFDGAHSLYTSLDLWPSGDSTPEDETFEKHLLQMRDDTRAEVAKSIAASHEAAARAAKEKREQTQRETEARERAELARLAARFNTPPPTP